MPLDTIRRNEILIHKENGIIIMEIDGKEVYGVSDYKITSSAFGDTELVVTIKSNLLITDLEICLEEMKK